MYLGVQAKVVIGRRGSEDVHHGRFETSQSPAKEFSPLPWALPVLLFIGLVAVCRAYLTCTAVSSPPLTSVTQYPVPGSVPLGIAYFAGRIYLATGSLNILLIGCALLVFGVGNLVAGWGVGLADPTGLSPYTTLHRLPHRSFMSWLPSRWPTEAGKNFATTQDQAIFAYACILLFVVFLSPASFLRMTPAFFVAAKDLPFSESCALSCRYSSRAVRLFAIRLYWQRRAVFLYWLGLALLLTATGLAAIAMQTAVVASSAGSGESPNISGRLLLCGRQSHGA